MRASSTIGFRSRPMGPPRGATTKRPAGTGPPERAYHR